MDNGTPLDFDSMQSDAGSDMPAEGNNIQVAHNQSAAGMDFDSIQDDESRYGSAGQMAITAAEGVAHGVAGPLATLAETTLGVKPEDIRMRQETNPVTHGVGQAIGLGAGLLTGTGEAAVMTKAGQLAVEAAGLGKAAETAGLGYKVGSEFVRQAAEMAVLSGGDETSKMILNDPNQSAESALSNIGLSAALGGATGAAVEGTVKPLWNATAGPKVAEFLGGLKDHFNGGSKLVLPEETEAAVKALGLELSPEMRAAISKDPKLVETFSLLKETQNPTIMRGIEKLHNDVNESVVRHLGLKADDIAVYSENEAGHEVAGTFQKEFKTKYGHFDEAFSKRDAEAAKIAMPDEDRLKFYDKLVVEAMDKVGTDSPYYKLYHDWGDRVLAKDTVGGLDMLRTEIGNKLKGLAVGGDFNEIHALKNIRNSIGELQESQILKQAAMVEKEGGEYASALGRDLIKERQALNADYAKFSRLGDELTDHLSVGNFRGAGTLESKIMNDISPEQLLKKFSFRNNADFIPFLKANFPETYELVRQNELKNMLKPAFQMAKGENEINLKKLNDIIDKNLAGKKEYVAELLSPDAIAKAKAGQLIAESIPNPKSSGTAGWMTKVTKNVPASVMAAVGAMSGHGVGGPVAGYLLGEMAQRLGRDAPDAIRLGYLKYMGSDQPIKAEGFKAMVDFFHNTYKGENMLAKSANAVFKSGAQVLGKNLIPDQADRDKLDKAVIRLQKAPSAVADGKDDLGHYLPNHQMAMTESTTRALQYLQGIKPQPHRASPLDREIQPSPAETARYNRALDIAQQPAVIMEHIKNGTLQMSDIKDLNALYPSLYKNMAGKLTLALQNAVGQEDPIPYRTRISASLFLGQPMDSTMTPMAIQSAQPKTPANPPQPQQGGGKSMSKLGKTNKMYQTPLQASESDRSTRKDR